MRYTTIGRRVVKVKIKSRPAQRHLRTTPPVSGAPTQDTVPPLFDRTSVSLTPPRQTRRNWKKTIVLSAAILFPVALAATGYAFFSDDSPQTRERPETRTTRDTRQTSAPSESRFTTGTADALQIRPMGYTGMPQSAAAPSGSVGTALPSGLSGAPSPPPGLPAHRPTGDVAEASAEDIHRAAFEEGRRVVLPDDAAGNCAIAHGGIRDLSTCLARAGARAE